MGPLLDSGAGHVGFGAKDQLLWSPVGLPVTVNPRNLRDFAWSIGLLAKPDNRDSCQARKS